MWLDKFFIALFFAKFIKLLIKPSDFSGCRSQPRCPPGHQYCVFIIGSTKARLLINHQAELLCYQFIPLLYLTVGECQAIVTSIPERGIFPCFKKLTIFLLKIAHFKKFFNSFPLGHKYLNSCISYYLFYYL